MTNAEINRFLILVARDNKSGYTPKAQPRQDVLPLLRRHLTAADAESYLKLLRQRRAAGIPLVQKPIWSNPK